MNIVIELMMKQQAPRKYKLNSFKNMKQIIQKLQTSLFKTLKEFIRKFKKAERFYSKKQLFHHKLLENLHIKKESILSFICSLFCFLSLTEIYPAKFKHEGKRMLRMLASANGLDPRNDMKSLRSIPRVLQKISTHLLQNVTPYKISTHLLQNVTPYKISTHLLQNVTPYLTCGMIKNIFSKMLQKETTFQTLALCFYWIIIVILKHHQD